MTAITTEQMNDLMPYAQQYQQEKREAAEQHQAEIDAAQDSPNYETTTRKPRKSTKAEQNLIVSTVLVEGIHTDIVTCTAREDFTKEQVTIKVGQRFFLIRSDRAADRFYVVGWNEDRLKWQCSCGAGCKAHSHVNKAGEKVKERVAKEKQSAREHATDSEIDEESKIERWTAEELANSAPLNGNRRDGRIMPPPLSQAPTCRKVSIEWLCNRY